MDVREKLVELQSIITCPNAICNFCEHFKNKGACEKHKKEVIADNMIAHGVTVQDWISVKDRLPEHGDVVLCFIKFGEQRILQWDNVSNWWLGYGHGDDWQKADVTHWCCLPKPPKGE